MKNFFCFIACLAAALHALTLEEVRSSLKEGVPPSDSSEIGISTAVSSPVFKESVEISVYLVRKGPNVFAEVKSPLSHERTIICGNRMKSIDLDSRKSEVLPYNGETLEAFSYANLNPLDSGEWADPKLLSGDLYVVEGSSGSLQYNAKKKRLEELSASDDGKFARTVFAYDATGNLKTLTTTVSAAGMETIIVSKILKFRHSKDFPDKLFEF